MQTQITIGSFQHKPMSLLLIVIIVNYGNADRFIQIKRCCLLWRNWTLTIRCIQSQH